MSITLWPFVVDRCKWSGSVADGNRGSRLGPAVFVGRNRFAVFAVYQRPIVMKNLNNETTQHNTTIKQQNNKTSSTTGTELLTLY